MHTNWYHMTIEILVRKPSQISALHVVLQIFLVLNFLCTGVTHISQPPSVMGHLPSICVIFRMKYLIKSVSCLCPLLGPFGVQGTMFWEEGAIQWKHLNYWGATWKIPQKVIKLRLHLVWARNTLLLNETIDICFCNMTWSVLTNPMGQCQEIYFSLKICFAHSLVLNLLRFNIAQQVLILWLKAYCAKHSHHKGHPL